MSASEVNTESGDFYSFTTEASTGVGEADSDVTALNAEAATAVVFKNSTLNTLNRWIPDKNTGSYFTLEAFKADLQYWEGCPIVRANEHLNPLNPDFNAELKRVNGRIVGYATKPRIEVAGTARLMAELPVSDAECLKDHAEGHLTGSTAFTAYRNREGRIVHTIRPHHILLFREDENNQPRDKSVLINKMEVVDMGNESTNAPGFDIQKGFDGLKAYFENKFAEQKSAAKAEDNMADTEKITELNKEVEKYKAEAVASAKEVESLKASVANKDAEIDAGKKEVESLKGKLSAFEQKEKDAQWATFKNQVKPAFLEGDKEKALREKFEADKGATIMEALANGMFVTAPASKETGSDAGFVASENKDDKTVHGAGNYNPITGKWE
jgi:hypothetical protein